MKQERSFSFDDKSGKYVLLVKQEAPVMDESKKQLAMQFAETKQVWEAEEVDKLLKQIVSQETNVVNALESSRAKIKAIGKFDERERNMLKDFKRNLERVQQLQQLEQLEQQRDNQQSMLDAIQKDKKEIEDAIKSKTDANQK